MEKRGNPKNKSNQIFHLLVLQLEKTSYWRINCIIPVI